MSDNEIAKGSLGISERSHSLLVSLVYDDDNPGEDRPFESIVEAFRFAFALGFDRGKKRKREGKSVTVAPRQFVVTEYFEILRDEIAESGQSLGAAISEYAEAGCFLMSECVQDNSDVVSLILSL